MRTPTIWVVSDTHIDTPENLSSIVRRGVRPPNHTALSGEGLKRLFPHDILIHLGDVIDKDEGQLPDYLAQCPARTKILCLGNHDGHSTHWYLRAGFSAVVETFTLPYGGETILFSHRPVMTEVYNRYEEPEWDQRRGAYVLDPEDHSLPEGIDLNIHGHLHLRNHRDEESAWQDEEDERWFLFSLEAAGYLPAKLDSIINGKVPRVLKRDALKYVHKPDEVFFEPIPKS